MSRTLETDSQHIRHRVALSDISKDLGLPDSAVRELRNMGIRSADDFLGLIYAGFEDLVHELNVSREELHEISLGLRKYIDPYILREMEDMLQSSSTFSTGAELGPVPNRDKIPEYEED